MHEHNVKVKYADESCLLISSRNLHTAADEFTNIVTLAAKNNLCLNRSKTKGMIIQRKSATTSSHIPTIIPGASRVDAMCVLGVTI